MPTAFVVQNGATLNQDTHIEKVVLMPLCLVFEWSYAYSMCPYQPQGTPRNSPTRPSAADRARLHQSPPLH